MVLQNKSMQNCCVKINQNGEFLNLNIAAISSFTIFHVVQWERCAFRLILSCETVRSPHHKSQANTGGAKTKISTFAGGLSRVTIIQLYSTAASFIQVWRHRRCTYTTYKLTEVIICRLWNPRWEDASTSYTADWSLITKQTGRRSAHNTHTHQSPLPERSNSTQNPHRLRL